VIDFKSMLLLAVAESGDLALSGLVELLVDVVEDDNLLSLCLRLDSLVSLAR
jgi:hypothetical protein